jgi:hypothetical protein
MPHLSRWSRTSACLRSFGKRTRLLGSILVVLSLSGAGVVALGPASASTSVPAVENAPTTFVVIPSSGAALKGSTYLDAGASNATSVQFRLFGGIYGFYGPVVCTATPTLYGWLCAWNTTTVPDNTYTLASEAFNSTGSTFSSGVGIQVNNTNSPPATHVVVPTNGAALQGKTYLDAGASNATSIQFRLFGGIYGFNSRGLCTATPTIYGWLCSWNTTDVPDGSYDVVSEAFNSAGSTFSSGVSIIVNNSLPNTWTKQSPLISPPASDDGSMAYDPVTHTSVLFGGETQVGGGTTLDSTWEWNGTSWSIDNPVSSPSPRLSPAVAYDPVNRDLLLFGGQGPHSSPLLNDTWSWNGNDWTQLSPAHSPPGGYGVAAATNTQGNYVLLVTAGYTQSFFQTWEWNGSDWTQESPETSPTCIGDCSELRNSLAYDPVHNVMLLQESNVTWEWNGFDWLQLNPATQVGGLLTTGPQNEGLLALTAYAATWSGSDWTELTGTVAPSARTSAMFSDGPTGAVLFGGDTNQDDFGHPEPGNQTWVFGPETQPPAATP